MGVDGHQYYFSSSGHPQESYWLETMSCNSQRSANRGNARNRTSALGCRVKSSSGADTSVYTKDFNNFTKLDNTLVDSTYHSAGPVKGSQTGEKLSTCMKRSKGGYKPTCGPRSCNHTINSSSSGEDERSEFSGRRSLYNLKSFQTAYDDAKFYIIKSFSEDDIHKCIKYNVWSSTEYANRKLDAAFHDVVAKTSEAGTRCPIFLFYSVNRSKQFVGVAEMVGPVDFAKDMDFWQSGRWIGFFPVKWHIIKDVPSTQLLQITLKKNNHKPLMNPRNTDEIGLEQGLEMLKIFKNYPAKTSMLDDWEFYENRGKSIRHL